MSKISLALFVLTCGLYAAVNEPSPVPEPGTYLLIGAGLIGVALVRRRKKA